MKQRWKQRAILFWKILTNKYFIAFLFDNQKNVRVVSHIKAGITVHPMVDDVILAIKKQDYLQGE